MDKLTTKIMSYSCKMADITEEGVSREYVHVMRTFPCAFSLLEQPEET